jgi:hypothetical protein
MVTRGQRQRREEVLQARMCQGRKEDRLLLRNSRLCRSCHLGIVEFGILFKSESQGA